MAIDGTPPRKPRRSAWDRSMLLLFRISSGSGTSAALQDCTARIGWCHFNIDWAIFGRLILFQCQKKNTNSWGWFTDSYPESSGTSSSIRINSGGIQSRSVLRDHREVSSRHVWTFSWQFTLNLPSQCEFVSLLEVAWPPGEFLWLRTTDIVVLHMYNMCICVYYI